MTPNIDKRLDQHQVQIDIHSQELAVLKERTNTDSERFEKMGQTLNCINSKSNENALAIKGVDSAISGAKTVLIIGLSVLGFVVGLVGLLIKFL